MGAYRAADQHPGRDRDGQYGQGRGHLQPAAARMSAGLFDESLSFGRIALCALGLR
jgi:hypothetical protein